MSSADNSTTLSSNRAIITLIQENVVQFSELRVNILADAGLKHTNEAKGLRSFQTDPLHSCVSSKRIGLAFCGENSSGKTTFLHQFMGIGKILPVGDGPITARITRLVYAAGEEACVCVYNSIRDQLIREEIDLKRFFIGEKPDWKGVAETVSAKTRRPDGVDEKSEEFASWARSLVEVRVPSPVLKRGIDVYDTPGFLFDDSPVLEENLRNLVALFRPTIVFMYGNPSTGDEANKCFIAMQAALHELDHSSLFFLNSKADIGQIPNFKSKMSEEEFKDLLERERARRYDLLLKAPFLCQGARHPLPTSVDQCPFFDICSTTSQTIKPYGPIMNQNAVTRILQFVRNHDVVVANQVCKLVLPTIDTLSQLFHPMNSFTTEEYQQMQRQLRAWADQFFKFYNRYLAEFVEDLFSAIMQKFEREKSHAEELFKKVEQFSHQSYRQLMTAIQLLVITPAIRETLAKHLHNLVDRILDDNNLNNSQITVDILVGAIGHQIISDATAALLDDPRRGKSIGNGALYMINTITTALAACASAFGNQSWENIDSFLEFEGIMRKLFRFTSYTHDSDMIEKIRERIGSHKSQLLKAAKLYGMEQKCTLVSLITSADSRRSTEEETLVHLDKHVDQLMTIEGDLIAARDMTNLADRGEPIVYPCEDQSKIFSTFNIQWGNEKFMMKKLTRSLPDQPTAAYFEANYHNRVARLHHPNILNMRYLYRHSLEDKSSELWMIFPVAASNVQEFIRRENSTLSVGQVVRWLIEITEALAVLHRNGIVHGNVTINNILLSNDGKVLLADRGDWNDSHSVKKRHHPANQSNEGRSEDFRKLATMATTLCESIVPNEKNSYILSDLESVIKDCSQATRQRPISAERVLHRLETILKRLP